MKASEMEIKANTEEIASDSEKDGKLPPITEEEQKLVDLLAGLMVDRYFVTIKNDE
jgi:hypothetical protein